MARKFRCWSSAALYGPLPESPPGSQSMPLHDDLLEPIEGENPSGPNLQYDKIFDQIKEARQEDDESIPSGTWERAIKKADRPLVIKLSLIHISEPTRQAEISYAV